MPQLMNIANHGQEDDDTSGEDEPRQKQYSAGQALDMLAWQRMLRPGVDAREGLACAARVLHKGQTLQDTLSSVAAMRLPGPNTIRRWMVRLDLACMAWSQCRWQLGIQEVNVMAIDASQQHGRHYLSIRCDTVSIPEGL